MSNNTIITDDDIDSVPTNSKLENEFKELLNTVGKEIAEKVKEASKILDEACDLADKHGIPFYSPVSHIGQTYAPKSFKDIFFDLDKEFVEKNTEVSSYDLQYPGGWQHSQVC